jgi:hypothetical protein
MRHKKDSRIVSSEFVKAHSFGTGEDAYVAIGNPDRHTNCDERKAYLKEWKKEYKAEAEARRELTKGISSELICTKCWQRLPLDQFSSNDATSTGFARQCKPCRAAQARERREWKRAERE